MTDDSELLRRYAENRDEAAFTEWVRLNIGLVYATALRRMAGDAHGARDVTQEVFLAVARRPKPLAHHQSTTAWLYAATRNVALNHMRDEQRRQRYERQAQVENESSGDTAAPSSHAVNWERLRPVLDLALDELNEADREVVLLRFFEGRPFAEVGRRLQLTENGARMRVERALDKLHARLARRGITSTSAALGLALGSETLVAAPAGLATSVAGSALAGSAGMGVVAAGIFMQTNKIIAAAVVLGALGVAVFQYQHARDAEKVAADLNRERDNLADQVREAQQRADESAKQGSALRRDLEAARAKPIPMPLALAANPPPVASSNSFVGAPGTFYLRESIDDPVERARWIRAQSDANVDTTFGAFFAQLGWTAAQQQQFRDLTFEHSESRQKLVTAAQAAARKQNPNIDRAGLFEVSEAASAQIAAEQIAEVRRIFGDTAAQALESYQSTWPMRVIARQVASELLFSNAPLAPAQAEQLIAVLAANSRGLGGGVEMEALNVDAAVVQAQARNILTPAQLADFRKVAARIQEQVTRERERNRAAVGIAK